MLILEFPPAIRCVSRYREGEAHSFAEGHANISLTPPYRYCTHPFLFPVQITKPFDVRGIIIQK